MVVLIDKPLRRAMSNPEAARRMALWVIELSEFDVKYRPRTAIKGQVVVDFIAEFTSMEGQGAKEHPQWSVHTDESSNGQASEVGVVLYSPEGDEIECMVLPDFPTTNNEAEYEALVVGLDLAKAVGATNVVVYCNSQVVTSQVNRDFECKGEKMKRYLEQMRKRVGKLKAKFIQVPRKENEKADCLAKVASKEHMLIPNKKDAQIYVKTCDKCQRFCNVIRKPTEELTPMMDLWPFAQWGLDIMDPFLIVMRQLKFLVVDINYFTKWVEAEALATIIEKNGSRTTTPPRLPSGQRARGGMNRSLLKIIKTRLKGAKGIWPDELPSVLWAYRTIARTPTRETSFRFAYGSEAIIPIEVELTSNRVDNHDKSRNDKAMHL
ncbi:uncharacterized protein LOC142624801 [Castanea sativa]|uniref:uncharacterized protein LOC142624801 n=1 Tax=Castanea sativa TaxID=21020 RepID=UPI003F6504CE